MIAFPIHSFAAAFKQLHAGRLIVKCEWQGGAKNSGEPSMNVNDRTGAHSMSGAEFYMREVFAACQVIRVLVTRNRYFSAQTLR